MYLIIHHWNLKLKFTFHIVSKDPIAAGTNHTEFIIDMSEGLWTNWGVKKRPKMHPVEPDKPSSAVASVRCSSANQCWLIFVGTHAIKGQAIPVSACPIKANWNLVSVVKSSERGGNELRKHSKPPKIKTYIRLFSERIWLRRYISNIHRWLKITRCFLFTNITNI